MTAARKSIPAAIWIAFVLLAADCGSNRPTKEASVTKTNGVTSTAPSGNEARQARQALIRFINATAGSKDLYFGDAKAFAQVKYKQATPYAELPAGHPDANKRHELKLFAAGHDWGPPLATNIEGPSAGKHYTVLAVNQSDGVPALSLIEDDLAAPAAGKAKVRVIHAGLGVGEVDIYRAGSATALIGGVAFNRASAYKEVDPTMAELDIRRYGKRKDEIEMKGIQLMADKLYTIVLIGAPGRRLTSEIIEDQLL
jgi:hypothetical protein